MNKNYIFYLGNAALNLHVHMMMFDFLGSKRMVNNLTGYWH